jgi:uncharacterized protein YhaN
MRILKLELERYGHFTGKTLEFRSGASLHVVYGANEAGKTSALNAFADLLFGFPPRTPYNFVHDNPKLLLGATVTDKDGSVLSFKRRKGTSKTLLDMQGAVLPDDALTPFLGLIDRSVFLNAWGLSKESLTTGALQMLKSGGEAGISLFAAASGMKSLIEIQKRLEMEASNIFTPTRAQARTFYQAKDRFDAAAQLVRTLELAIRDLKARRVAIVDFKDELEKARSARGDVIKNRELLVRLKDIGPILHLIASDERALQEWEHLPLMDGSRVRQLREVLDLSEEGQRELARLRREEAKAKDLFESFVVDNHLIEIGPAIQELVGELGSYADKKKDRPRIQGEADEFKEKLQDSAVRLGLPADTELALVRPNEMLVAQLKEQIKAGRSIATSISANAKSIRDEKVNQENLKKQQSGSVPVSDPKSFHDQLGRLMPALGQLKEIERLERSTAKESAQIKEKAAQLSPPVSDLEALALASLPTKDVIDEYRLSAETLVGERKTLEANLGEVEQSLPGLQLRVDELAGGQLASSPEKIAAARLERDDHWLPLKSALLAESKCLTTAETAAHVIGLEEGIGTADRLSDDAVLNADRLAKHAAALKNLKDAQAKQENLTGLLSDKGQAVAQQEKEWQTLWQPLGFQAATPIRMSVWVGQVGDLLERRENNLDELQQISDLKIAVNAVRSPLNQIAQSVGISECEALPVNLLLAAVEKELGLRAEAWQKSSQLVTRLAAVNERIEALVTEKDGFVDLESAWKAEWYEVLSAMHLPLELTVDGAAAALEIWNQVPSFLSQFQNRTTRVEGMDRDMKKFQERTSALLEQLDERDFGLGPDAAIKAVSVRLNKAQQVETQANMAQSSFKELERQVLQAEVKAEEAAAALELLCEGLPPSSSRVQQVLDLEARDAVLERLKGRRQTLLPLSRGQSEEDLRHDLESFDEATAVAEIEALKIQEGQHNQRENEVYASLSKAEGDLAKLEGGVGAEIAVQLRKNAEAELIENTRAWAVKRFAQILLAHAIEQHRSQQEQPLLKKASHLFSLLTANSFAGVEQELDESDTFRLVGRRDADHTLGYAEMSEGAQFQLYLSLRLAYLDEYAQKAEPMPFIGDDLLASFDDERTRKGLTALSEIGTRIQPILFTHHSKVVDLAQEELGEKVDVINLD